MENTNFTDLSTFEIWYDSNILKLNKTCDAVERLIASELDSNNIQYLPILKRIKTKLSARDKLRSKMISGPYEITDLIGIRVVVLLENDIDLAAEALKSIFSIDIDNCVDKRKISRVDAVGYRSLHLVASLGERRATLPEYRGICSLKFEVQIRTALQHTWAEIEHKRNYKGQFALPPELQRRLMILSGTLELIDREFSQISIEANAYKDKIEKSDGSMQNDALSFISTGNILTRTIARLVPDCKVILDSEAHEIIARELSDFGIRTVKEFNDFLGNPISKIIAAGCEESGEIYALGFIRDLMICVDVHKYFKQAFKDGFGSMEISDLDYLKEASGNDDIGRIISSYGVDLIEI